MCFLWENYKGAHNVSGVDPIVDFPIQDNSNSIQVKR